MIKDKFLYDPSLVLYVPLYQLDGATFQSKDAYGHLFTVTSATKILQGFEFDGTNDDISTPDHNALDATTAVTLISWFYPYTTADGTETNQVSGKQGSYILPLDHATAEYRGVFAIQLSSGWTNSEGPYTGWTNNAWNMFTGVYNGADILTYNGITLVKSRTLAGATIVPSTNPFRLGWDGTAGVTHYTQMKAGATWVYSRAFSPQEIQRIYLATKGRYV